MESSLIQFKGPFVLSLLKRFNDMSEICFILPLIKVLLGLKRQARNFWDIYILVILVSKQFATFLHIS